MKLIDGIRFIWNALKKVSSGGVKVNSQKDCTNCPVVYGDNNTIGANIITSAEKPEKQKPGDYWYHITGTSEENEQ